MVGLTKESRVAMANNKKVYSLNNNEEAMNCERLRVVVLQALLTLLLSTGCAKTYAPALTLPASDKTIDAVVEFHPLNATSSLSVRTGHIRRVREEGRHSFPRPTARADLNGA